MAIVRGITLEWAKYGAVMIRVKEASEKMTYLVARVLRNPHLYVVAAMVALLVVIHYCEVFPDVPSLKWLGSTLGLGLERHTLQRILFLVPVTYASATLGLGGGLSTLALVAAIMLPRAFLISPAPREAFFEAGGVIFTGAVMVAFLYELQKGKQRLVELERTQSTLNLQIQRLGMLHVVSNVVSRTLEPDYCLAVMDKVAQLMQADAAWLYLWDKERKNLRLASSCGLSSVAVPGVIGLSESLDGMAADSGQSVVVENLPADMTPRSSWLGQEGLQSVLIICLTSKGELVGTLGVGTRMVHSFAQDELDLLTAVGDQITMAVDNSHLYESERQAANALRVSEKNYRELFENASDAIWVHDFNGKILAANIALAKLTGYERDELIGGSVSMFLSSHSLAEIDKEAHEKVLRGEVATPYEQELIKKDGNKATIQIGTSLITKDEEPWAFQHVARDITEEKAVQENLRFYVHQVSQAQEAERKRIARELHDETAQALVVVSRNLDDLASGNPKLSLEDIRTEVKSILQGVRLFSQELRPSILDDLGLLAAVNWLASDLQENYDIVANVEVAGSPRQLSPEAELVLFRIAQEALANVRRHSKATRVHVKVEFADHGTKVMVSDDGKGFEAPTRLGDLTRSGRLGLAGMQERAHLLGGTLTVKSEVGRGTTLTVEVPL